MAPPVCATLKGLYHVGTPAQQGGADARRSESAIIRATARAIAAAPPSPCVRGKRPRGHAPFLRRCARPAADRDLVRENLSSRFPARDLLLPHFLRPCRWQCARLLSIRRCRCL